MKNIIRTGVLIVITALLFQQSANGQRLLKNIARKAQQSLEQKVEEKAVEEIDEEIDKSIDRLVDSLEAEQAEPAETTPANSKPGRYSDEVRMQKLMKGLGMSGEPVPVADSYQFGHLIQMHVEEFDNSGKKTSEGEFITHLDPKSRSMAYQVVSGDMANEGQGMFIIDAENDAMIILSEENNEKTGIVYGIGTFFQTMGETYEEDANLEETPESYLANPNVKKTGRSKKIAGYNCDEYIYSDEETESSIWITTDMKMNTRDFFSTLFKTSLYSRGVPWGYMMSVTTEEKETGEKSTMEVTKVDENSNAKFALNEYQITNLGSFQVPAEEDSEEKEK